MPPPAPLQKAPEIAPSEAIADPHALLAAIEAACEPVLPPNVLVHFIAPIREAIDVPADKRDLKALLAAFEQVEDLLEAFFLHGPKRPMGNP